MRYKKLHDWNVSVNDAVAIQNDLRKQIKLTPIMLVPRLIAGADISYDRFSDVAFAAFVVLDAETLEVVDRSHAVAKMTFPYVPGLLTFREAPALLKAWEGLNVRPDVVIFDGQGIAHPRRLGIATHMGLLLDLPSIGCGKSKLTGTFKNLGEEPGSTADLLEVSKSGAQSEKIGVVLRTKRKSNPVFVSPGHRIDFENALRIVKSTIRKYRIPEPTRQAHIFVNELRRQARALHKETSGGTSTDVVKAPISSGRER